MITSQSIFLLALCPFMSYAVSKDLIYEACRREPTLSFCDAHYFGKPLFDRPKTSTTRATPVDDVFKEMNSWLEGYKDDTDDEDAQIEKSRRLHADKNQYCNKYHQNYQHYCQNGKDGQGVLEGVLNQFCAAYRIACDGVIAGVNSEVAEFPEPPDLEEDFEVDEDKKTTPKNDKTEEYCKQFKPQYKALCFPPYKNTGEFCQSFNENCMKDPTSSESVPSSPAPVKQEGFVEEPSSTPVEGAGAEASSKITAYCEKYSENFNYYCVGDTAGNNEKFCHSYKKNCPGKMDSFKESGTFLGEKGNGEQGGVYSFKGSKKEYCEQYAVNYEYYCKGHSDDPKVTAKFCPSYKESCLVATTTARPANPFIDENFPDFEHPEGRKKTKKGGKRRRRPRKKRACTADCDQKIYKHCTAECKCDYAYPYVQKFCNPPPLPLFLNTCRLWYNGCPKYERYHYASQFIYSKAEKGKKIEGPVGTQPISVVSPTGERLPVNVRQPGVGNQRLKDDPWGFNETNFSGPFRLHQLPGVQSLPPGLKQIVPNFEVGTKNRKRNATAEPEEVPKIPKDGKAKDSVPVVPSDSVFNTAVSQYGAFTDTSGILHRPRSRSPFTKPGLWEPNPDDPVEVNGSPSLLTRVGRGSP